MPQGRKAEDGVIPVECHLTEMSSAEYLPRTQANVVDSDATIIFSYGSLFGGSLESATYAHELEKPYHHVDLLHITPKNAVNKIMLWLAGDEELNDYDEYVAYPPPLECILNVAGSRESHAPGLQEAVLHFMVNVLMNVNMASAHFNQLGTAKRVES
ncbi:MAG: putative molybdenum carrier protein [Nitrospirota bacterium]|nr:putative molybdenum carrier protein [Nitrospirota bacterium]